MTTSVDGVALAVDRLAWCVSNFGNWMSLSWLCLKSSKTQVIWLGHKKQTDRINIRSVPVLSSSVSVVDSTCDLVVVIDFALSVWLLPASSAATSGQSSGQDPSPGVYILSARLLQCTACFTVSQTTGFSICSRSRMQRSDF